MSMIAPADEAECRQALSAAYAQNHPVCSALPAWRGRGRAGAHRSHAAALGKAEVRRQVHEPVAGKRVAILAFGTLLYPALQAGEALDATVVNMRFVKPLDTELLLEMAGSHDLLVTVEEGCVQGGAGSAVAEALSAAGVNTPVDDAGSARRVRRARRAGQAAGAVRARCRGHRTGRAGAACAVGGLSALAWPSASSARAMRAVRTQACEPQGSTLQLLTVFWGSISGLLMWPVAVS